MSRTRILALLYERPVLDWAVLVAAVVVLALTTWLEPLRALDAAARRQVYLAVAGLAGTLLGLTIASVNLLLGVIDKPLRGRAAGLPRQTVLDLSRILFSTCLALGALCLAAFAGCVVDGSATRGRPPAQTAVLLLLALAAARVLRVVVSLRLLLLARGGVQPAR